MASDYRVDPETRRMMTEFSKMNNLIATDEGNPLLDGLDNLIKLTQVEER